MGKHRSEPLVAHANFGKNCQHHVTFFKPKLARPDSEFLNNSAPNAIILDPNSDLMQKPIGGRSLFAFFSFNGMLKTVGGKGYPKRSIPNSFTCHATESPKKEKVGAYCTLRNVVKKTLISWLDFSNVSIMCAPFSVSR